ncbi:biotin--[acetyl-CoA-carboxylase] ligase [Clostridium sp. DL1XJH146]
MKYRILEMLKNSEQGFLSGQKISEELGISRAAIWKHMNTLKEEGYTIESVSRKGYKIISSPDILTLSEVHNKVKTEYIGKEIIHYDSIASTNTEAKKIAYETKEGTIIVAEEQIAGKGRMGRSWVSTKGKGIWMSIILKPEISPTKVPQITQIAAAAVAKALEELDIEVGIKWPNDIIINGKKICGILTEMSAEINMVNYAVLGIGMNVNNKENDFPGELKSKASSLFIEEKKEYSRKDIFVGIINYFEFFYEEYVKKGNMQEVLEICRTKSCVIGREIRMIEKGKEIIAKAVELNDNGELVVTLKNGNNRSIMSGEISIRSKDGYI